MPLIAAIVLSLLAAVVSAAPPTTCGGSDDYSKALCAYQKRDFAAAEAAFRAMAEKGDPDPQTIRAVYFLARTQMKMGRYEEAETLFIRIYSMSKTFYDEWNCDFLLGECRRARGKS
jgi:TolA-binding protein